MATGNWTQADIDKINQRNQKEFTGKKPVRKINTRSKEKENLHNSILFISKIHKVNFVEEHKFDEVRKFKFDWAFPEIKLAVEYEGLVFNSNKSTSSGKSGHTTVTGYTSNCDKYNLATVSGWRVLRYTAMNSKQAFSDIEKILIEQYKKSLEFTITETTKK